MCDVSVHTALHCMQRGLSDRKAVRPSVGLSIKTKESSADILIPHERSVHLVFWHEEWLIGRVPFYLKFWAELTPSQWRHRTTGGPWTY